MQILDQIGQLIGSYSGTLLGALVVLVIGWLVAIIASGLARKAVRRTGLDKEMARRLMGKDRMEKAETVGADRWIGKGVYYLIMFFVLVAFFQALGLTMVVEPINRLLVKLFEFAPRLLGAIVLVLIAWILASVLRRIFLRVLTAAGIDDRVGSRAGLEEGKELMLSKSASEAVYWLVLLLFVPLVLDALALQGLLGPVQLMINRILAFLPNIFAAAIILVVGWFVARILQQIVTNLLAALGSERFSQRVGLSQVLGKSGLSGLLGMVVYVLVLIPVLIAAIQALALDAITAPATGMLTRMLGALPDIFAAAIVLAIAFALGRVVGDLAAGLLAGMGFDSILARLGICKETAVGERTPSQVIGYLVLVGIMLFAAIEASRLLKFELLAELISRFTVFAGQLIMGLVILAIGIYLARLARRAIMESKIAQARVLALAAQAAILIFSGAIALGHMGLANEIIYLAFGLLLGAVAVAVALAFGLGGREMAARELDLWMKSIRSKEP